MARTFRRKQTIPPISELNLTNLIDLGFTLLIIFMITAPLINEQTIRVNLPTTAIAPKTAPEPDTRFFAITIDERGNYFFEGERQPITPAELSARLAVLAAEAKPPVIRIRGHADVRYDKIAQLIVELQRVGLTRVTHDTQTRN